MSEFKELVKSFSSIRGYIRDFAVYGLKHRQEYDYRSARTYDNEKRRIESWLGEYIKWEYSSKGKKVFLFVDSAKIKSNPLYEAWKSKSFTSNDIMLHFFILHILKPSVFMTTTQLTDEINCQFQMLFEPQTIRNKLREYENLGILTANKKGKAIYYGICQYTLGQMDFLEQLRDCIQFFSESAPLGVIGNIILSQMGKQNELFRFKHHFIVFTLEDEILFHIVEAMNEKKEVQIENIHSPGKQRKRITGVPFKIAISTQNGRMYLCVYKENNNKCIIMRLDRIVSIKPVNCSQNWQEALKKGNALLLKTWGVSMGNTDKTEHIKIVFYIDKTKEEYMIKRILREKRMGSLKQIEQNLYCYEADVIDTNEMVPWIKSFTGRIVSIECTNQSVKKKLYDDMACMEDIYMKRGEDFDIFP